MGYGSDFVRPMRLSDTLTSPSDPPVRDRIVWEIASKYGLNFSAVFSFLYVVKPSFGTHLRGTF